MEIPKIIKLVLLIILSLIIFSCETKVEYVEEPIILKTALDSLIYDLKKTDRFTYLSNQITQNTFNSFVPNCYLEIKRNYYFNDSVSNLIDSLKVGDTLHINYVESACHHYINDIYSIIKQEKSYVLMKYTEPNYLIRVPLKGDSILISFYDSLDNKVNTNIFLSQDTSRLNKLAKRYLKQNYITYEINSKDIYHKIKELESITTTNMMNQRVKLGHTDCSFVFLWKNILQKRYYCEGEGCQKLF
jgi:hypothetical protein